MAHGTVCPSREDREPEKTKKEEKAKEKRQDKLRGRSGPYLGG